MTSTFDQNCYDLSCVFLDDCKNVVEPDRKDLASAIQQCIEEWLADRESDRAQAALDAYIDAQIDERRIEGKQAAYAD
jgi:hypothetical protein